MANTIPANNNTGLYIGTGTAIPVNANVSANNISASGNVTVGGYIIANGSITTNSNFVGNLIGNVTGNVVLAGGNTEVIYNANGVTGSSPAFTFNDSSNVLSVTGNIAGTYFIGNGSQLTGITAGTNYSNANVEAYLPTFSGNLGNVNIVNASGNVNGGNLSTTGNVSGSYIFGNGSQLSGITANYSNANVSAFLPTYSGNITANVISTTGNIVSAANLVTSGANGNIVGANYVSANFYLGDGGLLTNVTATTTYANSNVASFLAAFGSNTISTTGTVTSGNVTGSNILTGGIVSAVGNVRGANFNTTGLVSATGNVTGNFIIGDGSQLTNLPSGNYSNANVANYLPTFSGNLTAGNISTTGNITGNYILGNGSQLTGITTNYSNANVVSLLSAFGSNTISTTGTVVSGNVTGSNLFTAGVVSATGNVTGNYFIGNGSQLTGVTATSATTAGTVTTNAQPNITSVGTLTSLTSTGNISTTGNVLGAFLYGDGSNITGLPASYGNANVATYLASGNVTTDILTTGNVSATANITGGNILTSGTISATANVVFAANANIEGGRIQTSNATGYIFNQSTLTALNLSTGANLTTVSAFTGNSVNNISMGSAAFTGNINLRGNVVVQGNSSTGTGNLTISSGNLVIGGFANAAYLKTTATTGYLFNTANTVVLGNISANVGNVTTGANISAVGNVTGGNLIIGGANARIIADFGTSGVTGRTYFQSSGATTTFTGAIPGIGYTSSNANVAAAVTAFSTTDVGNASVGGIYVAYGNATTGYVGVRSATFGTGTLLPITFRFNNTESARIDTNGNLAIGNTAPLHKLVVNGTSYLGGNVTMTALSQVGTYTVATLTAITGVSGQYAAVSDGTGFAGGSLAFWDTTNSRWSWVNGGTAVA